MTPKNDGQKPKNQDPSKEETPEPTLPQIPTRSIWVGLSKEDEQLLRELLHRPGRLYGGSRIFDHF